MSSLRLPFPLVPASPGEASHYAKHGVGGLHYVGTADSLADIPETLKEPGMIVFVSDTHDLYTWTGSAWVLIEYVHQDFFESSVEDIMDLLRWEEFE
jgi:hypothetical protein